MSEKHVQSLVSLVTNFKNGVKPLPKERQQSFSREQHDVAETQRRPQASDRLLRLRLK